MFKHGWRPDRIDSRDLLYRKIAPPRTTALPDFVDLRGKCSPVESQGELGSCTAHALAGAVEFLEIQAGLPITPVSRLFIYYNERSIEGDINEDNGAQLRDGIKSLVSAGVCPETDWPYDISKFTNTPSTQAYEDAKAHVITSYHRLLSLDDMLGCLAEGFPFIFGMTVFQSFESDMVAQDGVVPMPLHREKQLGGHAVLAVGFNKVAQRFIVKNSWGKSWGQGGFFTIPFEYLESYADDFWTVRQ